MQISRWKIATLVAGSRHETPVAFTVTWYCKNCPITTLPRTMTVMNYDSRDVKLQSRSRHRVTATLMHCASYSRNLHTMFSLWECIIHVFLSVSTRDSDITMYQCHFTITTQVSVQQDDQSFTNTTAAVNGCHQTVNNYVSNRLFYWKSKFISH